MDDFAYDVGFDAFALFWGEDFPSVILCVMNNMLERAREEQQK